jgi:hypothetical protein
MIAEQLVDSFMPCPGLGTWMFCVCVDRPIYEDHIMCWAKAIGGKAGIYHITVTQKIYGMYKAYCDKQITTDKKIPISIMILTIWSLRGGILESYSEEGYGFDKAGRLNKKLGFHLSNHTYAQAHIWRSPV